MLSVFKQEFCQHWSVQICSVSTIMHGGGWGGRISIKTCPQKKNGMDGHCTNNYMIMCLTTVLYCTAGRKAKEASHWCKRGEERKKKQKLARPLLVFITTTKVLIK